MDDYEQFKVTYFAECAELLADLEARLSELSEGATDPEVLHAIFRAVHSIKAGAGAFKFTKLATFSHEYEALLDRMRDGRIPVTEGGISLLFRASDILSALVDAAESGTVVSDVYGQEILEEISAALDNNHKTSDPESSVPSETEEVEERDGLKKYLISFAPKSELFKHANEPLLLIRELKTLGEVTAVPNLNNLPPIGKMDGEEAYISWFFTLQTEATMLDVQEVFEFVTEDCTLDIVREGQVKTGMSDNAQDGQKNPSPSNNPKARADTENIAKTGSTQTAVAAKVTSIRVDLDRIDRLVNMVGELVITQSMLSTQTTELPKDQFPDLVRGLAELAVHTRELQESVMAIRMQPVKSVFSRMPRLVRELSGKLDKKVKLVTIGENTEVDKTVVEEISDPITHMIRNSLDHGLEMPDERVAAGKSEEGCVTLSAEHRGGRIIITISDDGQGINRAAVLKKARDQGIISDNVTPSDDEINNMIFAPGFSTAAKVTDVSGRGVGMDVVRRNIQALGGRVSIQSTTGKGSRFTMTLPLTLAVMDGMILEAGHCKYVIPIPNILESFRPPEDSLKHLPTGQDLVCIRGEYIPLCPLHKIFNLTDAEPDPANALVVLVESEVYGAVGIVVDQLVGQQQVVIKSLESNYKHVPGISAATILGNGKVAPILDIEALYLLSQQLVTESVAEFDKLLDGDSNKDLESESLDPELDSLEPESDTLEEVSSLAETEAELPSPPPDNQGTPIG